MTTANTKSSPTLRRLSAATTGLLLLSLGCAAPARSEQTEFGEETGGDASGTEQEGEASSESEGTSASAGSAGEVRLDVGGGTGVQPEGCAPGTTLVYLLSPQGLWSFDPATLAFEELLTEPPCGTTSFSMAIARDGVAQLLGHDGKLRSMGLDDLETCTELPRTPGEAGFSLFGMGYVSTSDGERIYAMNHPNFVVDNGTVGPSALGRLEPADWTVSIVAESAYLAGELTGTGDGRLFGVLGPTPDTALVEFDPETGGLIQERSLPFSLGAAYAMAHWGGDVFIFTEAEVGGDEGGEIEQPLSTVRRYDPDSGEAEVVVDVAPLRIIGAGVSTCAPLVP